MNSKIIAYIGKLAGDGMGVDRFGSTSRRELTDWYGNRIGFCALTKGWPIRSYIGPNLYQVYASIGQVRYTGRSFGEGMSVALRPIANQ